MRIVIAGAHGQIARRLGRSCPPAATPSSASSAIRPRVRRVGDGSTPVGAGPRVGLGRRVRSPTRGDRHADAVVFAAGAGPGSGAARSTPSTVAPPSCSPTPPSGPVCAVPAGLLDGRGPGADRATPRRHGPGVRRLPAGQAARPRTRSCPAGPSPRRSCGPAGSPTTRARAGHPRPASSRQHPAGRRRRRAGRILLRGKPTHVAGAGGRQTPIAEAVAALPRGQARRARVTSARAASRRPPGSPPAPGSARAAGATGTSRGPLGAARAARPATPAAAAPRRPPAARRRGCAPSSGRRRRPRRGTSIRPPVPDDVQARAACGSVVAPSRRRQKAAKSCSPSSSPAARRHARRRPACAASRRCPRRRSGGGPAGSSVSR